MNYHVKKSIIYHVLKHKILRLTKKDWKNERIRCTIIEQIFYDDREIMLLYQEHYSYYSCMVASNRLRDDEEFMREILYYNSYEMQFASKRLRDDEEFVRKTFSRSEIYFKEISDRLKDNDEFVKFAVSKNGDNFRHISYRLRSNFDIFMIAFNCQNIKSNRILYYTTYEFKNNREYMLKIIELDNQYIIDYLPEHFKSDKEMMSGSIKIYPENIKKFSNELLQDKEFIKEIITINSLCYVYLKNSSDLFYDKDIILLALKQDGMLLQIIPDEFTQIYEYILIAVKQNGKALEFAPYEFKKDLTIVCTAIEQIGLAIINVCPSLNENNIVFLKTIVRDKDYLGLTSKHIHKGGFRSFIEDQILFHHGLLIFLNGTIPFKKNKSVISKLYGHGRDFASIFKKLITNFSGIYIGEEWDKIIKVAIIYKIKY